MAAKDDPVVAAQDRETDAVAQSPADAVVQVGVLAVDEGSNRRLRAGDANLETSRTEAAASNLQGTKAAASNLTKAAASTLGPWW